MRWECIVIRAQNIFQILVGNAAVGPMCFVEEDREEHSVGVNAMWESVGMLDGHPTMSMFVD